MALGFGFNKQKVLASAEKAVQQGKLQNAISEYEKVVKEDPKDLTVLNTIGDLYARVGNNDKAAGYFKRVGDIYANEGFTVKAIAVYKKIAKLNPNANDCLLRLAELYTQQGLYNDARQQYVQIADYFMKESNLEEAAKIFQKILELDSENTAMQTKLADLYLKLGRKDSARNIFLTAAQALYLKGALDAADEALRRVVSIDPENMDALLLRGKIAADSGDSASAVLYLGKIRDLDSKPDALKALMTAQLQQGKLDEAEALARKLLTVHNDVTGLGSYADALTKEGRVEEAIRIYDEHYDKLVAPQAAATMQALAAAMPKIAENVKALETLRGLCVKTGEHHRINEVSEALAQACVHSGQLQKGAEIFKELSELEPENPLHLQNYKQILGKMGKDPTVREIGKEEGAQALMVDELEHRAPVMEQSYPDAIRDAVKAAVTEAELFESYNMPAKAIVPLEAALVQAPEDAQVNQRLASLYARSGRLQDAIARCQVLQKVYSDAGFADQAKQYREMADRYKERIDQAARAASVEFDASFMPGHEIHRPPASEIPAPQAATPAPAAPPIQAEAAVATQAQAAAAAAEFSVEVTPPAPPAASEAALAQMVEQAATPAAAHEIDLSDWEQMTQVEQPAEATTPPPAEPAVNTAAMVEEANFYLSQSLWSAAEQSIAKLHAAAPGLAALAGLQQRLAAGMAASAPALGGAVAEFSLDVVAPPEPAAPPPRPVETKPAPPAPVVTAAPAAASPKKEEKPKDVLADFVLDLDESLGEDFAVGAPAKASAPLPPVARPAAAAAPLQSAPPAKPSAPAKPAAAPAPTMASSGFSHPDASATLSDIFAEFKEDVEETADQAEDPDTHYNLGVAFKEMGLLDEAIGELQKVCHAIDKGHPFSQVMQAYTWLAHCFLEKGVPEASVKWYEKALKVPAIDEESKLAVHYELGSAYEAAGNKKLALQNFSEVYSNNIDYRDVAERIKALR